MDFYHDLITQKSWKTLQKLKKEYEFILIGGWAVFLYTKALKSKDIDLVMGYEELKKLKDEFEVSKNERLRKYEARSQEGEIDIYIPFYSNPGLPAEDLKKFTTIQEGFKTVEKEILAIMKQKALLERVNTVKGRKDLADLVSLFRLPDFNWSKYQETVEEYKLGEFLATTKEIIGRTMELDELRLNAHQFAQLKKKILAQI